jgi:TIR domain/Galactose oxidase, central domain
LAHQVFVSYATEDADTATRVCSLLEADGIHCWVAPRDVKAGTDYAAAIMDAIRNARLVVLVFSAHSNTSPYALREVERSVAYGRPVLALRTDDTDPNSPMEYYLHDWIDTPEGVESKRIEILDAVRERLARSSTAAKSGQGASGPAPRPVVRSESDAAKPPKGRPWYRRTWVIAVAAAVVIAAVGLGLGLGLTRNPTAPNAGSTLIQIYWTELYSGNQPAARDGHAMAYDPTSGRVIMFGGETTTSSFNDTWAYDPAAYTWTAIDPTRPSPTARSAHAMAYDQVTRRVIMFGGLNEAGAALDDTWAYDPRASVWTELTPLGKVPPARSGHALAYDPVTHRLIMFGGFGDAGVPLNDTWAYDPEANAWTELTPLGTAPPTRSAHAMVYDPATHRLIMFGGFGDAGAPLNDTWACDPKASAWTELKPIGISPSARSACAMDYDQTSGLVIIFGGQDSAGTSLNDTWAYDSADNTWMKLEPSGIQPLARAGHAMVYDQAGGRLTMFGGHAIGGADYFDDTWALNQG